MPLYEYRCPTCGKEDERVVEFDKRDDQACMSCFSVLLRLVSLPGPAQWNTDTGTVSKGKACK